MLQLWDYIDKLNVQFKASDRAKGVMPKWNVLHGNNITNFHELTEYVTSILDHPLYTISEHQLAQHKYIRFFYCTNTGC